MQDERFPEAQVLKQLGDISLVAGAEFWDFNLMKSFSFHISICAQNFVPKSANFETHPQRNVFHSQVQLDCFGLVCMGHRAPSSLFSVRFSLLEASFL